VQLQIIVAALTMSSHSGRLVFVLREKRLFLNLRVHHGKLKTASYRLLDQLLRADYLLPCSLGEWFMRYLTRRPRSDSPELQTLILVGVYADYSGAVVHLPTERAHVNSVRILFEGLYGARRSLVLDTTRAKRCCRHVTGRCFVIVCRCAAVAGLWTVASEAIADIVETRSSSVCRLVIRPHVDTRPLPVSSNVATRAA